MPDLSPAPPWRRLDGRRILSLRSRLLLLVVVSVVPLVGMGLIREYLDYQVTQREIYDGLLLAARGMAVGVERDLQLYVSSLETLATSPALQTSDLAGFDGQARAFLARQPPGTLLGLAAKDASVSRIYGGPEAAMETPGLPDDGTAANPVFATGRPVVTNLLREEGAGSVSYNVDVPVFHDGTVVYDLFLRLRPDGIGRLIARQRLPPRTVLTIVDAEGAIVGRSPGGAAFVGKHIVPTLWNAVRAHPEGVVEAPTLEGVPAVAAYTHVAPFAWAVIVGAPEDVVLAPMRYAVTRLITGGAIVLLLGLMLATWAARGITRPIAYLRRLAASADDAAQPDSAATGLPETDTVARALMLAATERRQGAAALAESENRFRALFEQSASGTILLDPQTTRIIDSNEVAAATVGLSVEAFRTRTISEFALDTSPNQIHQICRDVAAGASRRYETRIKGRNGLRDLLVAAAPVQVGGRRLVLLNQIDITDLRNAEAGLRSNEERLELAREGADLGIWDWDVVSGDLSWSDHEWYLHGLDRQAGKPTAALWRGSIHPADQERTITELVAAVKSPEHPYNTEYSVVLPDGSIRRLLGRAKTLRDTTGRAIRMVGINMDVTARYQAEMARDELIRMLEAERSRLSDIIEALPVGIGIVDPQGRVVLGNTMMTRLNGTVLQSMTATPVGEWIRYDAAGNRVAPVDYPIRRALRLGETTFPGAEYLYRGDDGDETWYRIASLPLRWEDGKVVEALGIFQDIDAEKRLRDIQLQVNARLEQRVHEEMAAREAAQQRAAHAERMHALGQIAGGIAHDFNNVLQAVTGGAALIERRPQDSERVLRNVRMVMDAARRGAAITSRLLAFSRRGDLRAERVNAAALLADMADVLTHTLGGSVVCAVDVADDLPPLFADRGQLETVLVNLATNARDAMPQGGTLTLSASADTVSQASPHPAGLPDGEYIRITVSDTGAGMEQSVLSRVTEPFFTTKQPGKGTGLGLAMAKGFVEQSGGSLTIDSQIGQGTSVALWLPVAMGSVPTEREAPAGEERARDDKTCVLLVDDDPIVRDVLAASLQDAGYAVHAVEGGASALTWLEADERADILVSDLTMPGMDGLALIRTAQALRPNLPAVLLTGYAGDGATLAVGGTVSGAFSLLRKPVVGAQLLDRISALLLARHQ